MSSKFKVGDKVIVSNNIYLPCDNYKKNQLFTVVSVPDDGSPIIDTGHEGWGDSSIGNSCYWHVDETSMRKGTLKNVIGGELL